MKILGSLVQDKHFSLQYCDELTVKLCWTDTQCLWCSWSELDCIKCSRDEAAFKQMILRLINWMATLYQLYAAQCKDNINSIVSVSGMDVSQDSSWNCWQLGFSCRNPEQQVSWSHQVQKENLLKLTLEITVSRDSFPCAETLHRSQGSLTCTVTPDVTHFTV